MEAVYDEIGHSYVVTRQPDTRIAAAVRAALGDARTVLNVGAGTGSYEPADQQVVAVEPSGAMIQQRPAGAAPVVQAVAEHLPWSDAAFDATLAILTIHHWHDRAAGLAELRRVAPHRVVLPSWHPVWCCAFWLSTRYVPRVLDLDVPRFPAMAELSRCLGQIEVQPFPNPHDCQDGFLGAFGQRPAAYLDPNVRRAIAGFAQLPPAVVKAGLAQLAADLRSGQWDAQFGWVRNQTSLDLGYRLIIVPL